MGLSPFQTRSIVGLDDFNNHKLRHNKTVLTYVVQAGNLEISSNIFRMLMLKPVKANDINDWVCVCNYVKQRLATRQFVQAAG